MGDQGALSWGQQMVRLDVGMVGRISAEGR